MTPRRCALGLSVHTGWAACVAASGSLRAPRVEARDEIELLADPDRFVFHRAAEMGLAEAQRTVAKANRDVHVRAKAALSGLLAPLRDASLEVTSCAVVAKDGVMPASLEQITAAHPRIHTAEGCFYRDALLAAAQALGLVARVLPPKELESAAATVMGLGRAQVPGLLTDAGRIVGRPWGKDQKMAALAAWIMLEAL
jgi:hypothetical protein